MNPKDMEINRLRRLLADALAQIEFWDHTAKRCDKVTMPYIVPSREVIEEIWEAVNNQRVY